MTAREQANISQLQVNRFIVWIHNGHAGDTNSSYLPEDED